jgi:transposase
LAKLTKDEIVTIRVLKQTGESASQIARRLRVTEGAIRYHVRRQTNPSVDGRIKASLIEEKNLQEVVAAWWKSSRERLPEERSPNAEVLWDFLRSEYSYPGSKKSVRKYLRLHFPRPKLRPFRRVETPPGAQMQTDWCEYRAVDIGDACGAVALYALVMVLSHSRKSAVIWCRRMDQLSWHHAHNEALKRLGGVAAVNRIDNLKTGIGSGAGPWGVINSQYRVYAKAMGFHVDACLPREPQQKGKTERRCGILRSLDIASRCFESLEALQTWSDQKLSIAEKSRICPITGTTIAEAWEIERSLLRQLPETLPEPFDVTKSCPVHKDCMVRFEGRQYPVPFAYVGKKVEVRGCADVVQIVDLDSGHVLRSHPRGTDARIIIDPTCYDGPATDRVLAPAPLGRMGRKLAEISQMNVQLRSIDIYAQLAEVAR